MNSRTRLACGVAIGYLLGRTRKMRLALMVAGATGAVGTPRQLAQRGLKQLASVPEVGKLTTMARGQLVDAAKTAAMTAASSRIDALNERLQAGFGSGAAEPDGEEEKPRRSIGTGREDTEAQSSAGSSGEGQHDEEPAEDESPRPRRRTSSTTRRRASADESDDKPRRTSTRRGTRAPVRRAGR